MIYSYLFSYYVIAHKYLVVNIITSNDDLQPSTVILEKSPGGLISIYVRILKLLLQDYNSYAHD